MPQQIIQPLATPTPQQDLITPEKLAQRLGVDVKTLAAWRCTGRYNLPFVKVGRKAMYQPDVVDLWLQKRTIRPAAMDARC